jgi:ABC-2 type transport system permease protein
MAKFFSDALVVFEMEARKIRAWGPIYFFSIVLVPIGTLLFAKALTPPGSGDQVATRLMTGSLVFGIGIMTVNNLAQLMAMERFQHMLKLIITSPIHPLSYGLGVVLFAVAQGMLTAGIILSFAPVFGIGMHLNLWLIPVLVLTSLSMTGMGIVIATWSPTAEISNMLANTAGIMLTMLSPVYYPMSRLPHWLRWPARMSPYTHAGQAVDAILSGRGGFAQESLILLAITVVGLTLGARGLRWRER